MNPVLTRPFGLAIGSLDLIPKEADYAFHPERLLIPRSLPSFAHLAPRYCGKILVKCTNLNTRADGFGTNR